MLVKAGALTVVVIGLAFVLTWKSPLITREVYRFVFFFGLAALGAYFFSAPRGMSSMYLEFGRDSSAHLVMWLFGLFPMLPFVALTETGIAGYRGFSSFVQYVALVVAVLGTAGIIASVLFPRLHRS
jgi:hypothetical protein